MHGKGRLTFTDGRKYEGEFHKDFMDGLGVFTWPDGRRYIGFWNEGMPQEEN